MNDKNQLKVIKSACSYLTLYPMEDHLDNIWGSAISNHDISIKFDEIIEEYKAGSEQETSDKLKELDCKFYAHELVRKLVIYFSIKELGEEIDYASLLKLFNIMLRDLVISKSQLEVGVKNAKYEIDNLLDSDEGVEEGFSKLKQECLSKIKFRNE